MDETLENPDYGRYIELCTRQLAAAMKGAKRESGLLAEDLIAAADLISRISPDENDAAANATTSSATGLHRQLRERVNGVVLRMQFADRLDQQIDNVRKNLTLLAEYIEADEAGGNRLAWSEFLQRSRQSFTMEQERFMFDTVLGDPETAAKTDRTCSYALLFEEGDGSV
ncbi:MAG: hypothetical protein WBN32_03490 [Woeseia sp.]